MMNCPTCAQPVGEYDVDCRSCGRALSTEATPAPHAAAAHPELSRVAQAGGKAPAATPNKHRDSRAYWRFAPAVLVGAAAGVMLFVFMNGLNGFNRPVQPLEDREDRLRVVLAERVDARALAGREDGPLDRAVAAAHGATRMPARQSRSRWRR